MNSSSGTPRGLGEDPHAQALMEGPARCRRPAPKRAVSKGVDHGPEAGVRQTIRSLRMWVESEVQKGQEAKSLRIWPRGGTRSGPKLPERQQYKDAGW